MPDLLIATCIGARAAEALAGGSTLSVRGTTSRGVYLFASPNTIVFLTRDPTPGPFTVNIAGFPAEFDHLANGDAATFAADRLALPTEGLAIAISGAPVWKTPPPSVHTLAPAQCIQNLTRIAHAVLEVKGWVGLAGLLFEMLRLDLPEPPERDALGLRQALDRARNALADRDPAGLVSALAPAIGRGPGLTPSGDDLIAGVLLALRRSQAIPLAAGQLEWLAQVLIAAAYEKTTTYSANLIEAAAAGEADERVRSACDAVFTGTPDPASAASAITHWGSSSGVDTLTGFALVALASLTHPTDPPQETP
jgi:hypothetical protein